MVAKLSPAAREGAASAAKLGKIAFELDLPAHLAVLGIGVDEFVPHAVVVGVLVMENVPTRETLHRGDITLADVKRAP